MGRKIVGIVLAGGQSRRFGSPKAFAERDGIPFYTYSIDAMTTYTESIVLVTNEKLMNSFGQERRQSFELITDSQDYAGLGPLAGIYTAMEKVEAEWYLIAPIDVPFIKKEIYSYLLSLPNNNLDAIVPISGGRLQPLISIFRGTMKEKIKEQLNKRELSMKQLLDKSKVSYVKMDEELHFTNINHVEEYNRLFKQSSRE
jgi:molybdenum cofactor guanylyltransferase